MFGALITRLLPMKLLIRNEGLPLSVLEGMGYGLEVITTPVGVISEVITHEVNGILVSAGNSDELAHALSKIISNSITREKIARNAKEHIATHYSLTAYTGSLSIFDQQIR